MRNLSLTIHQITIQRKVKSENLAFYQSHLGKITPNFEELRFTYLPRQENLFVDALEKLAFMIVVLDEKSKMTIVIDIIKEGSQLIA